MQSLLPAEQQSLPLPEAVSPTEREPEAGAAGSLPPGAGPVSAGIRRSCRAPAGAGGTLAYR